MIPPRRRSPSISTLGAITSPWPASWIDGVFANASLFHVPSQEISKGTAQDIEAARRVVFLKSARE